MKNAVAIIFAFLLLGCGQANKSLVGKYESGNSGLPLGYDWFLGNSYAANIELDLNKNHSFTYSGCTVLKGKWKTKNDSLLLFAKTHGWNNDSLNRVGFYGKFPEVPEEPIKFKITEYGFWNNQKFDYDGESLNAINKLVKVSSEKKTIKKRR